MGVISVLLATCTLPVRAALEEDSRHGTKRPVSPTAEVSRPKKQKRAIPLQGSVIDLTIDIKQEPGITGTSKEEAKKQEKIREALEDLEGQTRPRLGMFINLLELGVPPEKMVTAPTTDYPNLPLPFTTEQRLTEIIIAATGKRMQVPIPVEVVDDKGALSVNVLIRAAIHHNYVSKILEVLPERLTAEWGRVRVQPEDASSYLTKLGESLQLDPDPFLIINNFFKVSAENILGSEAYHTVSSLLPKEALNEPQERASPLEDERPLASDFSPEDVPLQGVPTGEGSSHTNPFSPSSQAVAPIIDPLPLDSAYTTTTTSMPTGSEAPNEYRVPQMPVPVLASGPIFQSREVPIRGIGVVGSMNSAFQPVPPFSQPAIQVPAPALPISRVPNVGGPERPHSSLTFGLPNDFKEEDLKGYDTLEKEQSLNRNLFGDCGNKYNKPYEKIKKLYKIIRRKDGKPLTPEDITNLEPLISRFLAKYTSPSSGQPSISRRLYEQVKIIWQNSKNQAEGNPAIEKFLDWMTWPMNRLTVALAHKNGGGHVGGAVANPSPPTSTTASSSISAPADVTSSGILKEDSLLGRPEISIVPPTHTTTTTTTTTTSTRVAEQASRKPYPPLAPPSSTGIPASLRYTDRSPFLSSSPVVAPVSSHATPPYLPPAHATPDESIIEIKEVGPTGQARDSKRIIKHYTKHTTLNKQLEKAGYKKLHKTDAIIQKGNGHPLNSDDIEILTPFHENFLSHPKLDPTFKKEHMALWQNCLEEAKATTAAAPPPPQKIWQTPEFKELKNRGLIWNFSQQKWTKESGLLTVEECDKIIEQMKALKERDAKVSLTKTMIKKAQDQKKKLEDAAHKDVVPMEEEWEDEKSAEAAPSPRKRTKKPSRAGQPLVTPPPA